MVCIKLYLRRPEGAALLFDFLQQQHPINTATTMTTASKMHPPMMQFESLIEGAMNVQYPLAELDEARAVAFTTATPLLDGC